MPTLDAGIGADETPGPSMTTMPPSSHKPSPSSRGLAWLSADWVALLVALGLAALVRAGLVWGVTW
jgi:hypothetical protein